MNQPSPLRALDLSDDPAPENPIVQRLTEARRELVNAYERIEHVEMALRGVLLMLGKLRGHPDVSPELHRFLIIHPRTIDAQEALLR